MPENIASALLYVKKPAHFRLRLFADGLLIGVLVGAIIALYHWLLESADRLRPLVYEALREGSPAWTAGYLLVLLARSVVVWRLMRLDPQVGGGGIPDIKGVLRGDSRLRWQRVLFGKFISVVLAIGAGLSLGRGGPSVEIGACVGAGVSRFAGRSRSVERFLLTAGAGAGFAAIFNAPLTSLVFSFEELSKSFSPQVLMGVLGAAIAAGFVTQGIFGVGPMFAVGSVLPVPLGGAYLLLFLLGVFSGALGRLFNAVLIFALDAWAQRVPPLALRLAIAFLAAGVLGFFLPDVLSGGNFLVNRLVQQPLVFGVLLFVFAGKFLFTVFCYGTGVAGGILLPVLVAAGAVAAGILPASLAPTFVVFGMAGFFAGSIKAPVTASLFIMEITGSFEHLLAVVCVAAAAAIVNDLTGGRPIYDELYERSRRLRAGISGERRRMMAELCVAAGSAMEGKRVAEIAWGAHSRLLSVNRGAVELLARGNLSLKAGDMLYVLTEEGELEALQQAAGETMDGLPPY